MSRKPAELKDTHTAILKYLGIKKADAWTGPSEIAKTFSKTSAFVAPYLKFLLNRRIIKRSTKGQYRLSTKGRALAQPLVAA